MKWAKHLLFGEEAKKHKAKYVFKIKHEMKLHDMCVIALPMTENNQLEIIETGVLQQKLYPKDSLTVVGIAKGYDEAVDVVVRLSERVLKNTGDVNIRQYLEERAGV